MAIFNVKRRINVRAGSVSDKTDVISERGDEMRMYVKVQANFPRSLSLSIYLSTYLSPFLPINNLTSTCTSFLQQENQRKEQGVARD